MKSVKTLPLPQEASIKTEGYSKPTFLLSPRRNIIRVANPAIFDNQHLGVKTQSFFL